MHRQLTWPRAYHVLKLSHEPKNSKLYRVTVCYSTISYTSMFFLLCTCLFAMPLRPRPREAAKGRGSNSCQEQSQTMRNCKTCHILNDFQNWHQLIALSPFNSLHPLGISFLKINHQAPVGLLIVIYSNTQKDRSSQNPSKWVIMSYLHEFHHFSAFLRGLP